MDNLEGKDKAIKSDDALFSTNMDRFVTNIILVPFKLTRTMDSGAFSMQGIVMHDGNNRAFVGLDNTTNRSKMNTSDLMRVNTLDINSMCSIPGNDGNITTSNATVSTTINKRLGMGRRMLRDPVGDPVNIGLALGRARREDTANVIRLLGLGTCGIDKKVRRKVISDRIWFRFWLFTSIMKVILSISRGSVQLVEKVIGRHLMEVHCTSVGRGHRISKNAGAVTEGEFAPESACILGELRPSLSRDTSAGIRRRTIGWWVTRNLTRVMGLSSICLESRDGCVHTRIIGAVQDSCINISFMI
jgi:hypothetical protein